VLVLAKRVDLALELLERRETGPIGRAGVALVPLDVRGLGGRASGRCASGCCGTVAAVDHRGAGTGSTSTGRCRGGRVGHGRLTATAADYAAARRARAGVGCAGGAADRQRRDERTWVNVGATSVGLLLVRMALQLVAELRADVGELAALAVGAIALAEEAADDLAIGEALDGLKLAGVPLCTCGTLVARDKDFAVIRKVTRCRRGRGRPVVLLHDRSLVDSGRAAAAGAHARGGHREAVVVVVMVVVVVVAVHVVRRGTIGRGDRRERTGAKRASVAASHRVVDCLKKEKSIRLLKNIFLKFTVIRVVGAVCTVRVRGLDAKGRRAAEGTPAGGALAERNTVGNRDRGVPEGRARSGPCGRVRSRVQRSCGQLVTPKHNLEKIIIVVDCISPTVSTIG